MDRIEAKGPGVPRKGQESLPGHGGQGAREDQSRRCGRVSAFPKYMQWSLSIVLELPR
ncbi:MAG: hypothetical protein MZU97_26990 [Bacillus subtilis]|nr:hypothetical protein [Bacillus subtilis]